MSAAGRLCYAMCSVCGWDSRGEAPVNFERLPPVCPECGLPACYEVCPEEAQTERPATAVVTHG